MSSGTLDATAPAARAPSTGYAWYVVAILLLAYTLSFIDRMILSLLVAAVARALYLAWARRRAPAADRLPSERTA